MREREGEGERGEGEEGGGSGREWRKDKEIEGAGLIYFIGVIHDVLCCTQLPRHVQDLVCLVNTVFTIYRYIYIYIHIYIYIFIIIL